MHKQNSYDINKTHTAHASSKKKNEAIFQAYF